VSSHAHSKYLSYLESEKQKAAVEAARKEEATQTAENIELLREKSRGFNKSAS